MKILLKTIILSAGFLLPNTSNGYEAQNWHNILQSPQSLISLNENQRYMIFPFLMAAFLGIFYYKYRSQSTHQNLNVTRENDHKIKEITNEQIKEVGKGMGLQEPSGVSVFWSKSVGKVVLDQINVKNIAIFLQAEDNGWPILTGSDEDKENIKCGIFREYIGFVIRELEGRHLINELMYEVRNCNLIDEGNGIHTWKEDLIYIDILNKYTRKCRRSFSAIVSLRNYQNRKFYLDTVNGVFQFKPVNNNNFFDDNNIHNMSIFLREENTQWSNFDQINHSLYQKIIVNTQDIQCELFKKYIKPILDIELELEGKKQTLRQKVALIVDASFQKNKSLAPSFKASTKKPDDFISVIDSYFTKSMHQIAGLFEFKPIKPTEYYHDNHRYNIATFLRAANAECPWRLLKQIDQDTRETKRQLFREYIYPLMRDQSSGSFNQLIEQTKMQYSDLA